MSRLVNQFAHLDLSEHHAKIYEVLITLGKATLKEIAEGANFPRSSCYEYVPGLIRLGLASEVLEGKTRYIIPESPEKVKLLLLEKQREIEVGIEGINDVIVDLMSQYGALADKPNVKFYKGMEGIKTVLNDSLKTKGELLLLCQGDEGRKKESLEDEPEYMKRYLKKFREGKYRSREIIENRGDAKQYKKNYEGKYQKILLAPPIKNMKTTHIDKIIYDNKIAIIAFDKKLSILIEDALIAQNERLTFEVLWNALKSRKYKYSV